MDFGLFAACHRFDESASTLEVYEQALEMVEFADQGHVVATSGACASDITRRFLAAPLAPVDGTCSAEGSIDYVVPP